MVVTPKDSRKLNEVEQDTLSRLEKEIDSYLEEMYEGKPVEFGLLSTDQHLEYWNLNNRIIDEVKKRYHEAGWIVKYQERFESRESQRDGPYSEKARYIVFSEARR